MDSAPCSFCDWYLLLTDNEIEYCSCTVSR